MAASSIAKKRSKADDPEALFQKVRRQRAQLTDKQVEEIESLELDPTSHMWRRAALATLAMSGRDLCDKIAAQRDSAVMFAELALGIRGYLKSARALIEMLDTAQMRIELLLCVREDCSDVRAEADRQHQAENAEASHG